jgi:hypothetical protein
MEAASARRLGDRFEGSTVKGYRPLPELAGPLYGKEPWPLRFFSHSFDARCHNTLACSMIYARRQLGTQRLELDGYVDHPSGPAPSGDWKGRWEGHHLVLAENGQTFPGPAELAWASWDGVRHEVNIDLDTIFKDRLVLHTTRKEDIVPNWLEVCSFQPIVPSILLELDNRTVRIYMRAMLFVFRDNPTPGGRPTGTRSDLILAWERCY